MPAAFDTYATLGLNYVNAGLQVLARRLVASGEAFSADDTAHGEALVQTGTKYLDNAAMLMLKHLEYGIRTVSTAGAANTDAADTWAGLRPAALSSLDCPAKLLELGNRGAAAIRASEAIARAAVPLVAGAAPPAAALVQQLTAQGNKDWDQFIDLAQKHIAQAFFSPTLWSMAKKDVNGSSTAAYTAATDKAIAAWQAMFPPMYGAAPKIAFPDCPAGILEIGTHGAFLEQLGLDFAQKQMPMLATGSQGAVPLAEQAKTLGAAKWAEFLQLAAKKMAEFFYSRDVWDSVGTTGQTAAKETALRWWNEMQPPGSPYTYATVAAFPWPEHLLTGAKGELYADYGEKLAHEQLPVNPSGTPKAANYAEQMQQRGSNLTNLFRTWAQSKLVQLQSTDWCGSVQDPNFENAEY
jgi:hypothetical protein